MFGMFTKLTAGVLVLAGVAVAGGTGHAQQATYRVVGTGDSILSMTLDVPAPGGTYTDDSHWIDVEHGRQPNEPGMSDRNSTAGIWPEVLAHSRKAGWVIVQDNGIGATLDEWTLMLHRIVDELPDDRCLLFVLPVFHPDWRPDLYDDTVAKADVMVTVLAGQPCNAVIHWDDAVLADPGLVYDGQHPTVEGIAWLRAAIDAEVGR